MLLSMSLTDMRLQYVVALVVGLVALQGFMLWVFGQPFIAASGEVKLWEGVVQSSGNSQHLSDWYTFSHFIHGLLFYWLLGKFFPKLSMPVRFLLAVGIEVGWELLENTPWLIEHYRQQALAQGYMGDSVLNSISDTVAMMLGFVAALRMPVWASVGLGVVLEATSLWFIRDGLVLNAVNLLHHFEFVGRWQEGGS